VGKSPTVPSWQRALLILAGTVVGGVVITCLYFGQKILIPVALAAFLTFLLSPLVSLLQRWHLGRAPSVILVVLAAALMVAGVVWLVTAQVTSLVADLPRYSQNIRDKIKTLREMGEGPVTERLERLVQDISGDLKTQSPGPSTGKDWSPEANGDPSKPAAVVVEPDIPPWMLRLPTLLGSLAETLGGAALAVVLVIFMLLNREDLRNRLIRLVSYGRITVATKAVDEAGQRMSRFLLMQAFINAGYGITLGLGLLALGVKYALLWGFLAGVLRYIPYIGAWIASILPIASSLAMSEGWMQPLEVLGVFLVIELITNNVLEPRLYGRSIGVSEVALLVSAAFWAFLWGPIGLVLSSPLTVCLVVLGKYVPALSFLDVLLGDEPALAPDVCYYQRLLARDHDEAAELVRVQAQAGSAERVYDELLVPALNYARGDYEHDDLTDADVHFVYTGTEEIVEDLSEQQQTDEAKEANAEDEHPSELSRVSVLGCPARDQADYLGLQMLRQLLDPARWDMEIITPEMLTAELLERVAEREPAVVCVGALPPGSLAHTRYLCKRLRARFPQVKIVVGRWGLKGNVEQNRDQLREVGADLVATTLLETRDQLNAWHPVLTEEQAEVLEPAAV
jgi:predicted PurR-regulated permease PerM